MADEPQRRPAARRVPTGADVPGHQRDHGQDTYKTQGLGIRRIHGPPRCLQGMGHFRSPAPASSPITSDSGTVSPSWTKTTSMPTSKPASRAITLSSGRFCDSRVREPRRPRPALWPKPTVGRSPGASNPRSNGRLRRRVRRQGAWPGRSPSTVTKRSSSNGPGSLSGDQKDRPEKNLHHPLFRRLRRPRGPSPSPSPTSSRAPIPRSSASSSEHGDGRGTPPGARLVLECPDFPAEGSQASPSACYQGHRLNAVKGEYVLGNARLSRPGPLSSRTAQPLGSLAAYLLEPESDDGLAVWNFFDRDIVPQWGRGFDAYPVHKLREPAVLDHLRAFRTIKGRVPGTTSFSSSRRPGTSRSSRRRRYRCCLRWPNTSGSKC